MDAPTPKFIGCKRLYKAGVGYFIDNGPEFVKLADGPSKMQVATLICLWPTDANGNLDKTGFTEGRFQVMPWIISVDKYKNIEQNHKEFPLGQHDLTVNCTDTQFQKMTMSPCRENLFRKIYEKDPTKASPIIEKTKEGISLIQGELAQNLSIEQVREKLAKAGGGAGGNSGGGGGGGGGNAGGSGVAQNSKDFDNMLDDLLG